MGYFDKKKTGVLQERLNGDCRQVADISLNKPMEILKNVGNIAGTMVYLYFAAPKLMAVGFSTVPVITGVQYFMAFFWIRISKKLTNYRCVRI